MLSWVKKVVLAEFGRYFNRPCDGNLLLNDTKVGVELCNLETLSGLLAETATRKMLNLSCCCVVLHIYQIKKRLKH